MWAKWLSFEPRLLGVREDYPSFTVDVDNPQPRWPPWKRHEKWSGTCQKLREHWTPVGLWQYFSKSFGTAFGHCDQLIASGTIHLQVNRVFRVRIEMKCEAAEMRRSKWIRASLTAETGPQPSQLLPGGFRRSFSHPGGALGQQKRAKPNCGTWRGLVTAQAKEALPRRPHTQNTVRSESAVRSWS